MGYRFDLNMKEAGVSRSGLAVLVAATALCTGAAVPQTTRLGGHTYAFPPTLFMDGEVETGPVGGMLIELAWPEMRPLTADEASMWPPRDTIRVLANNGAPVDGDAVPEDRLTADMAVVVSAATELSSGIHDRASGHPHPPRPAPAGEQPLGAVPGAGMQQVATEAATLPDEARHDVFVRMPIDRPQEVIACTRKDQFPDPDCAQSFIAMSLIMKASYSRALVPQWRAIHDRLVAYLEAHEVKP